jgi:hypothetical protein
MQQQSIPPKIYDNPGGVSLFFVSIPKIYSQQLNTADAAIDALVLAGVWTEAILRFQTINLKELLMRTVL